MNLDLDALRKRKREWERNKYRELREAEILYRSPTVLFEDANFAEAARKYEDIPLFMEDFFGFKYDSFQQCILRDKSKKVVVCAGRQQGKSAMAAGRGLHKAVTGVREYKPDADIRSNMGLTERYTYRGAKVLLGSPSDRQSKELLEKVESHLQTSRVVEIKGADGRRYEFCFVDSGCVVRNNVSMIEFDNGSVIHCVPVTKKIRAFSADLMILDEAAHIEDSLFKILTPMLGATQGDLLMISTPNGTSGYFYEAHQKWDDYSAYHRSNEDCLRITADPGFLESERRSMTESEYNQEHKAEFVAGEGAFFEEISTSDYRMIMDKDYEYVLGVDWGKMKSSTVVTVLNQDARLCYLKEWRHRNYSYPLNWIKEFCKQNTVRLVLCDLGAGQRQVEELVEAGVPARGFSFSGKIDLMNSLKMALELRNNQLVLPLDGKHVKQLLTQLSEYRASMQPSGYMKLGPPSGEKYRDDYVDSLALAWRAWRRTQSVPLVVEVGSHHKAAHKPWYNSMIRGVSRHGGRRPKEDPELDGIVWNRTGHRVS